MLILMIAFLLAGCDPNVPLVGEVIQGESPVLLMELIPIPCPGIVAEVEGDVVLKPKALNEYAKTKVNDAVGFGDILGMNSGASVRIVFGGDLPHLTIGPFPKDTWITFEKAEDTPAVRGT